MISREIHDALVNVMLFFRCEILFVENLIHSLNTLIYRLCVSYAMFVQSGIINLQKAAKPGTERITYL